MSTSSPEVLIESLNNLSLDGHDGHSEPHKHGKEPDYNVTQVSAGGQRIQRGDDSVDDSKSHQRKNYTKIKVETTLVGYVKTANSG